MQTATEDPLVGRVLEGRYRIAYRIARGGMSTVYAAVDQRLDRNVAVKVMSAALSADPAFSDRFAREARATARLQHTNVVSVYDQGTDPSNGYHVFLVMELVEGRTLRDLLRERGRLSPAEALSVMEPMLGALAAAHRAGIVHRDVKPENVLISDDGLVKVADFGLAHAVGSDAAATRTGLMMGTVAYCAPEQISRGHADPRSDVYSAGIVLFELLTGRPPYLDESAMTVAYRHVHDRVPAPSEVVGGIPAAMDDLVRSATDSDAGGRPIDAGAFLAQVSDVRADLALPVVPIPARTGPRGPRMTVGPDVNSSGPRQAPFAPGQTPSTPGQAPFGAGQPPFGPRQTTEIIGTAPAGHATAAQTRLPVEHPSHPVEYQPVRRSRRRRAGWIALLVLIILGLGAGYGAWYLTTGRFSHVPNVAGESATQATNDLRSAGYTVDTRTTSAFSETVAKGAVLSTDPGSGARLVRGRRIELVLSSGPERFVLPTVNGETAANARQELGTIPIGTVTAQTEYSQTVPTGEVTRTDPVSGTQVKRGQPVTMWVSKGLPPVTIPVIAVGTPYSSAHDTLVALKFAVKRVGEWSTSVSEDGVISVSPTGTATQGATITVTVSKGPQMIQLPKLRGHTWDDADSQLTALGFTVAEDTSYDGGALDTVVTVQVAGSFDNVDGKKVLAGSSLVVVVV